jgi:uncharacterized membrane protein
LGGAGGSTRHRHTQISVHFTGEVGFLVGLATIVMGLVATAQRRQSVWLIGLIATWLFTIIGPFVAGFLRQYNQPTLPSICQVGSPTVLPNASQCQFAVIQLILVNAPTWLFLAGPLLVGLVGLIYSYCMRDPVAVTPTMHS